MKKHFQRSFNLTDRLYAIRNYMSKHGNKDETLQNIMIIEFLKSRNVTLEFKDGIKYIHEHFGLFCQFANNEYLKLTNLTNHEKN